MEELGRKGFANDAVLEALKATENKVRHVILLPTCMPALAHYLPCRCQSVNLLCCIHWQPWKYVWGTLKYHEALRLRRCTTSVALLSVAV